MHYPATITQKGQITIPKQIRDALALKPAQRIMIDLEKDTKEIKIKPVEDFLDIAKRIRVKKKISVLKAREYFEKNYERV